MSARRSWRNAAMLALAAGLALALGPGAAADEHEEEPPTIGASLTSVSPAIATAATPVSVAAAITNTGLNEVVGLTATLAITTEPIADASALDAWLAEGGAPTREVATSTPRGGRVPALGSTEVSLSVPAGDLELPATAWGVWGLEVEVTVDGEPVRAFRSAVTWRGAQAEPASVPLTIVATVAGSPERASALATAAGGVAGVDIALDPTALAADAAMTEPGYLLPAGHLDLVSVSRADQSRLLDEALARAGLGDTGAAAWLAVVAEPDAATLTLADRRGAAAVVVEPAYRWEGYSELATVSQYGDALAVVAPDPHLSDIVAHTSPADPTARAVVTAYGTMAAQRGAPVIVSTGPSWLVNGDQRSPILAALTSSPWLLPTPLAEAIDVADRPSVALASADRTSVDIPPGTVFRVSQAVSSITALAAAVEGDEPLGTTSVPILLRSLSTDGRLDPDRRGGAIDSALETALTVRESVGISEGSALNLFTSEGNVPLSVYNDLSVPVSVRVVMESRSPNLVVKGSPEVIVEPGSERQVHVPVEAVSSANVTVSLYLENLDGAQIAQRSNLSMRVRADWGQGFTVAVALLAAALFSAGIYRTIRRGRGDTRTAAAEPEEI